MKLRLRKTEIEVSFTLLCLLAAGAMLGVLGSLLWCAAAVAVHEGGHLLTLFCCGYFPKRIKISLFEIDITDSSRHSRSFLQNVLIIFFGPFANFICFLPCFLLYLKGMDAALPFAAANASVGLFNLLPVMSLDGGQLIYLFLSRRLTARGAERAVDALTFIFIFPVGALGFLLLLRTGNISLVFVSVYLVFSLFFKGNRFE